MFFLQCSLAVFANAAFGPNGEGSYKLEHDVDMASKKGTAEVGTTMVYSPEHRELRRLVSESDESGPRCERSDCRVGLGEVEYALGAGSILAHAFSPFPSISLFLQVLPPKEPIADPWDEEVYLPAKIDSSTNNEQPSTVRNVGKC